MKAGSKVIMRLRALKALSMMKKILQGADTREEVKAIVAASW